MKVLNHEACRAPECAMTNDGPHGNDDDGEEDGDDAIGTEGDGADSDYECDCRYRAEQ